MLTINLGDIATRIVRALGIRGRVPTSLDEVAVPTVQLMDLTDPIFAQNPSTWAFRVIAPGDGATNGWFEVTNINPNTKVIIDRFVFENTSAAPQFFSVYVRRQGANSPGTAQQGILLNVQTANVVGPNALLEQGPPGSFSLANSRLLALISTQVNGVRSENFGVVLYPGDHFTIVTSGVLVTNQLEGTVYGREFIAV